jgi:sigma-E factor negative regulatory protein RseC
VQLSHAFGAPRDRFALPATPGLQVGDRVRITIPDGAPLRAALLSYGLGVALLLLGAALGTMLGDAAMADLRALLGALAGLALAFAVNRVLVRSRRWRASLHMELVAAGDEARPDHACTREAQ